MKGHTEIRELLTLAAAGSLTSSERRRVEEHLSHCEACRTEFDAWVNLTDLVKQLPIPQAPPKLVLHTKRLLVHAAFSRPNQPGRLGLACLILFSWVGAFVTLRIVRMFDMPQWLDVSSAAFWTFYLGTTWLATALAAGLLGKHWRQESRTV